jgi:hypothetical protein
MDRSIVESTLGRAFRMRRPKGYVGARPAETSFVAVGAKLAFRSFSLSGSLSGCLLVALLVLQSSCASGPSEIVHPGRFERLAGGEGFLVIHVDAELGVEKLDAGRIPIARDLPVGNHLWIIRAKAGRYRWTGVRLVAQRHGSDTIKPDHERESGADEFSFDVEEGKINYPGHLLIRLRMPALGIASGVSIRNRNHSAMAIRRLSKSHPELIAGHPIRYAGTSGDRFLQFYTQERSRLRGEELGRSASQEESQ